MAGQKRTLSDDDVMIVVDRKYFKCLTKLVRAQEKTITGTRILQDYLAWQTMAEFLLTNFTGKT